MSNSPDKWTLLAATVSVCVLGWQYLRRHRNGPHNLLPPGPQPYPIVGNALDIPGEYSWLTYAEWTKRYGDIVYANALGRPMIILGSLRAVEDLLERRSSNFSDRPRFTMAAELMGFDALFSTAPYGARWKTQRRLFHGHFGPAVVSKYVPVLERWTWHFCNQLLKSPEDFKDHIRQLFGLQVMEIVYGIDASGKNDPSLEAVNTVLRLVDLALIPGGYLVDLFPLLKHIPEWVPGAYFKRLAVHARQEMTRALEVPMELVRQAMHEGSSNPCVASRLLENEKPEDRAINREVAGIAYIGGADTTVAFLEVFFMAMATHPEVQLKAQAELDAALGGNRLPTFADHKSFPYIDAIITEALRWQPVGAIGLPHATIESDEYRGYHIPAGTTVITNVWALLHDPEVYPLPEKFDPERFLTRTEDGRWEHNKSVPSPRGPAFGFGRRACPGQQLAEQSFFLAVSAVLSSFSILPPIDPVSGEERVAPVKMTGGVIS